MKRYRLHLLSIMAFAVALSVQSQESTSTKSRMDRNRLNIGTYHLKPYACTEAHVKDLADCGIDFVVCMQNDKNTLDLFSKYHVGAVVNGVLPGWWGGDGDNAGKLEATNPLSKYEEGASKFEDHPAVWGVDIGDEPSALDFPYYGKVFEKVDALFPNQFPYLNLYPNYASVSQNNAKETVNQLGTPTYAEHIASYCQNVPADYICYDFYLYSINVQRAYENLRVVADACTGTQRSMWIVLQVNSNKEEEWISENELRFQAYTAMAFGAENIIWACYTAGWWYNQVLDEKGEKTQQYEKLKKVNGEIHRLSDPYMKYRRTTTSFVGFEGTEWLDGVKQASITELDNGVFSGVKFEDGTPMVVGSMLSRSGDGSEALFICSADDPFDRQHRMHELLFKAPGRQVIVTNVEGKMTVQPDAEGFYRVNVPSSSAVLVEALYE